jgi:hypothetical protein
LTANGLEPALTLSVAEFEPTEVGSNETLILQVAPTATELAQSLVCANAAAFAPPSVMLVTGTGTTAVFVTVTEVGAVATFVNSVPNATDAGSTVNVGATPVPLSATVCGATPVPTLTLKVAVADPTVVGLNTRLILQLAPTATELPQVFVCEKGCGLRDERAMPVMESAILPVFVTVTTLGALATFVAWLPNAIVDCDTV